MSPVDRIEIEKGHDAAVFIYTAMIPQTFEDVTEFCGYIIPAYNNKTVL